MPSKVSTTLPKQILKNKCVYIRYKIYLYDISVSSNTNSNYKLILSYEVEKILQQSVNKILFHTKISHKTTRLSFPLSYTYFFSVHALTLTIFRKFLTVLTSKLNFKKMNFKRCKSEIFKMLLDRWLLH